MIHLLQIYVRTVVVKLLQNRPQIVAMTQHPEPMAAMLGE
jgi:hypothetical protein